MKQLFGAILSMIAFYSVSKSQNVFPATGNVGIGIATPGTNLVVNGNTRILSHLTIGANEDPPSFMPLMIKGSPQIGFSDISQPTDQRLWLIINQGSKFRILTEKDDYSAIQEAMVITRTGLNINTTYFPTGNVGIGTSNPGTFKLAVEGKIGARGIKVTPQNPWPDYVFIKDYNLMDIQKLHEYIKINKHLPNMPSAKEVKENDGIELGDMSTKLLVKIEELTLYVIQLKEENEAIKEKLAKLTTK